MKPVIVLGAGGHAKVLLDTLLKERPIIGLLEPDESLWGTTLMDVPILGKDELILDYSPEQIDLVNGLGGAVSPKARQALYDTWKRKGYSFSSVIHKQAVVSPYARLTEGVQIMPGAIVNAGSDIRANSIINTSAVIEHDCTLDEHVHIAPGAVLAGGVSVGKGSHIGMGARIIQNLTVGEHCLIGAGAVVLNSVKAHSKAVGVPAKVIP